MEVPPALQSIISSIGLFVYLNYETPRLGSNVGDRICWSGGLLNQGSGRELRAYPRQLEQEVRREAFSNDPNPMKTILILLLGGGGEPRKFRGRGMGKIGIFIWFVNFLLEQFVLTL